MRKKEELEDENDAKHRNISWEKQGVSRHFFCFAFKERESVCV